MKVLNTEAIRIPRFGYIVIILSSAMVYTIYMETARKEVGNDGERFAQNFLKENGWKILDTNVRLPWNDEIDIVARDTDGVLVFVEVKTVSKNYLNAEEQMTSAKIKKCMRSGEWYANHFYKLVNERAGWRIDCVALKKERGIYSVNHYKQIIS